MDVKIEQSGRPIIRIGADQQHLSVGSPRSIVMQLTKGEMKVNPQTNKGLNFKFVSQIIAGGAVTRMTQAAWDVLVQKDEERWYFITNNSGTLKKIYAGSTLFAEASASGNIGFPYTFPMTF